MTNKGKRVSLAYYRTSSATNVGEDKGSLDRQREAVQEYAAAKGLEVSSEHYDAAVSGADPIDTRRGFSDLLMAASELSEPCVILVENATRFSRDLAVQLAGHALLQDRGIELVPVDAPTFFTDPSPTAEFVRNILGAASQFEKAQLVEKLRHGRMVKRQKTGRCEGRKPVPDEVKLMAKKLNRARPKGGKRSLREIAKELAVAGSLSANGKPYNPNSVRQMLM
jgi:DNA invertase Pin-like site-specific DNA recombinase